MYSITSCSRLIAVALGASLLVACDSIKDVPDGNGTYLEVPPVKNVIGGEVYGLGAARPIVLSFDGSENCIQANSSNSSILEPAFCAFFGLPNQERSTFSFGSRDVGIPYFVEIVQQPFSKVCTVNNGTAPNGSPASPTNPRVVGDGLADVVITCVTDTTVPRFDLIVDTTPMSTFDDAVVTLVTEDGTWQADAEGQTSVTFDDVLFNSGTTNLPNMQYRLTASYTGQVDGDPIISYCSFEEVLTGPDVITVGGTNVNSTTNIVKVPTGDTNVAVEKCTVGVQVTVQYDGTPAVANLPTGGLQLGLRNHFTQVIGTQTLAVPGGTAFSDSTTYEFPDEVEGHSRSMYEVVVTQQPAGMHCIVSGSVTAFTPETSLGATASNPSIEFTGATGSAVITINPSIPEWWFDSPRPVICRNTPTDPSTVLTGTYQRDRALPTATQIENDQRPARAREFLTFFDDGTFLYGINSPDSAITTCPLSGDGTFPSCSLTGTTPRGPGEAGPSQAAPLGNFNSVSGVDHGFYVYDPAADTIVFTLTNASNTFPNYLALNGMPGYLDGEVTATNVQKTDATADEGGKISLRFVGERPGPRPGVGSAFTAVTESTTWNMTEPLAINGEITGAWITADHLRVFAYNKNEFFGFYMSADGLLTLQDACYLIDDLSTQSAGTLNRHSGFSATCSPGGSARFRDIPVTRVGEVATMPKLPLGYQGRYPGSDSPLDGRPAQPSLFEVTAGVGGADDLEVHATLSGTPIDDTWAPSFFTRERANPAVP